MTSPGTQTSSSAARRPPPSLPRPNEACWCGSGEKYKRCHKEADYLYLRDEQKRLVSVDASSIELERGRWFFSPAACRDARAESDLLRGCSAERGAAH